MVPSSSQSAAFTSIVRHSSTSMAEGYPAFYRIIMDQVNIELLSLHPNIRNIH